MADGRDVITPPNMSAYQPDRIRLPGKKAAQRDYAISEIGANMLAAALLADLLIANHGSAAAALKAYRWGADPKAAKDDDSWIEHLPAETRAYVLAKRAAERGALYSSNTHLVRERALMAMPLDVVDKARVDTINSIDVNNAKPT